MGTGRNENMLTRTDVVKQFLDNQSVALQNATKELELKSEHSRNLLEQTRINKDIAIESINASKSKTIQDTIKWLVVAGLICGVLVLTIVLDKDDLARDLLKYVGGAVLGFIAGRGSAHLTHKQE